MTRAFRAALGSSLAIVFFFGQTCIAAAQDPPTRQDTVVVADSLAVPDSASVADSAGAGADSAAAVDDGEMTGSTLDGVYTEAQAERGKQLMWDVCAECHFEEDYTGAFFQDWVGASVWGLWESIWSTMPEDNPGGLAVQDYTDAVAYMFQLNGLPPGEEELPTDQDALEKIKIEWESGGGL